MRNRFIAAAMVLVSLWGVGAPLALSASAETASQAAGSGKHSCCPREHFAFALPIFVSPAPATMPCGGQSPCCAKQAPAKPAIVAVNQDQRPALEAAALGTKSEVQSPGTVTTQNDANLSPSLLLRSAVLRI